MPALFRHYFKEIAEAETRSIRIAVGHYSGLPPGEYGFIEFYCNEENCDCRRVHLMVVADWSKEPLAMIAYGWEPPSFYRKWSKYPGMIGAAGMAGLSLEPMFKQSKYAHAAKKLCEGTLLADAPYVERLKRHYQMMRDYVDKGKRPAEEKQQKKNRHRKASPVIYFPSRRLPVGETVSTETVRQALLSPHEAVRISAASFFNHYRADNLSADIMKTVIQSVELYGIIASLGVLEMLAVPQDETTVRWLVQELRKDHDLNNIPLDNYCYLLSEILSKVDSKLLTPEMVNLPHFAEEFTPSLLKRLELAKTDWEILWEMLLEVEQGNDDLYDDHYDVEELLVEALARHEACKSRVLEYLRKEKVLPYEDDQKELLSALFQIVAKNRLTEAKEFVLDEIRKPIEFFLPDGHEQAFCCLADENDWEELYSRWKKSPLEHRWFTGLLVSTPSKKQLEIALDMLQIDSEGVLYDVLMGFLLDNYAKESHSIIAEMLNNTQNVSQTSWVSQAVRLVVSAMINGSDSLADFDDWLGTVEEIEWNLEEQREQYTEQRLCELYAFPDDDDDDWDDDDDCDDDDWEGDDESPLPLSFGAMNALVRRALEAIDCGDDDDESLGPFPPKILRDLKKKLAAIRDREEYVDDDDWDNDDDFDDDFDDDDDEPVRVIDYNNVGRNDPCPCGSGKKYKVCCLKK